jgi:hypothetical protein
VKLDKLIVPIPRVSTRTAAVSPTTCRVPRVAACNARAAPGVAAEVGIEPDDVVADALPEDKVEDRADGCSPMVTGSPSS